MREDQRDDPHEDQREDQREDPHEDQRDDLPANLGQILMLSLRDFQRRLDDDLHARNIPGIGRRHREVFLYLGRHGPSRSVDIAHAAGIRPQSMMTILHELEDMGMIERHPDPADSRAKLVSFTRRGKTFVRELGVSTRTVWEQYATLLGEKRLNTVIGGLQALLDATQENNND